MDLDRFQDYQKNDLTGLIVNINEYADLIETTWEEMSQFALPSHYIQSQNIVLIGGSTETISNILIKEVAKNSKIPIIIDNSFEGLSYVNSKTLVIGSSYSGEDKIVNHQFEYCAKQGAKLIGVTSGGILASLCRKYKSPIYEIHYGAAENMTLAFSLTVIYSVLQKLGIVERNNFVNEAIVLLKGLNNRLKPEVTISKNIAKQIAIRFKDKIIIGIGSELMQASSFRLNQQISLFAHQLAFNIELNTFSQNGFEAINFLGKLKEKLIFLIFQSHFDNAAEKLLQSALMQFFDRKGIAFESVFIQPSNNIFSESIQSILLIDYIAFYLAVLCDRNPNDREQVNQLKEILDQNSAQLDRIKGDY